ncbi:MAG TPA: glycosyltransferase, partial [Acidobacteriota bacterium]|nr:glycosyltransferase [Acidobacteriota bacterium]
MQGRDVIIVSTQDFDDLWTRKQRWASRLAHSNRVLYVESQMHWLTLLRTWPLHRSRLRARRRALRRVRRNLWVWTPPVIWPFFQMWRPINRLNNRRLSRHLQKQSAALGFRGPLLWLYTPYSTDLIDALRPAGTIYESVDDFSAAKGLIRASVIRRMEDTTFQRADLTLVTTPHLGEIATRRTTRWRLSPNACDVAFFARAGDSGTPVHPALRDRPRPIFGFVGAVAYWVDCELLAHLARARPDATVVVVGPVRVDIAPYAHIPNLVFLGEVPYASLLEVLRGFDVCLNPYKTDNVARGASPLKLYEYLATGKPVVSTPMPEAERFSDVVRIAGTYDDFVAACNAVCEEMPEEAEQRRKHQHELVAPHTWEARFSEIEGWLDDFVPVAAFAPAAATERPQPWTFTRTPERSPRAEKRSRHVVVNALSVTGPELAGGFTFLTNILRPMIAQHRDVRFSVVVTRRAARHLACDCDNLRLIERPNIVGRGPVRAVYERHLMPRLLRRLGADAYYLPYGFLPSRRVCPQIMVFQNLYVLHADEYAHWSAPHWWARLYERIRLGVFSRRLRSDCLAADRILAVSETARRELVARLNIPDDRIAVVHEGVGPPFIRTADTAADTVARMARDVR